MTQRNNRSKEEVAGIIKSILVADKKSSTIGVPVAQLEDEYRAQDGTRIPYRLFGYACLMDFLESLQRKGEIVIGKRGSMHVVFLCVDEKIAHVSALVSGQKDTGRRCSRGGKRNTPRYYPRQFYQPPMLDSKTLADVLRLIKNAPNGMHVSRIIEYLKDRNHFNVDEDRLMRQLREISHEISIEHGMIYPIMKKQVNSPPKNINSTNRTNSAPAYGPAGLSDNEEDNETFEFVRKCDDVQPVKNPNQFNEESKRPLNSVQIPNADFPENRNSRVDHDNEDIGILVNSRTRFRLEKLIQKHPNGIWCAELPNFYHKEYSIPLNYEELGFGNLSDFAANLPDIFHCVRLQEHGDFKLFDAKGPKPERRQNPRPEQLSLAALHNLYESYHDEVEPVPVLLSPTTSQRLVPEGVMTIGETVAQICVTQLFSDNTPHIDVIVVDTVTPTFFWIQILKKTQKFDRFMHDLHEFYSENASKYIMPIVVLERGLNCACIYDKQWHRGVIKAVKPNNTVTVLFYDYGTVLTYPPQDIHFLHRSFSSLPAQAIPCGLYNVKPIATEKWPYSVCQVFAEKVLNVPMVAMLGSIDPDNNSMLIALTNTEDVADFHISDWMISSGFAVYGKMGETVDMNEKFDDSATGGPPETSPRLPTIEESNNLDSSNPKTAQSSQILDTFEIQCAKMREAMESQFNTIMNQLKLTIEAYASKSRQSETEQTLSQSADSKALDDLLSNMKIAPGNEHQTVSSEPPPLPPRPNKSYTSIIDSYEIQNRPKVQSFNGNEIFQENMYVPMHHQKSDVNMNRTQNPFDYPTVNNFMPPSYNLDYQFSSKNNNQLDSAMWNDYINNETRRASSAVPSPILTAQTPVAVPQVPRNVTFQNPIVLNTAPATFYQNHQGNLPITPQEMRVKDPVSLITPRETFEMSLEESAKSFFTRLDAKLKPQNQETNPFKIAIGSDKFQEQSSLPGASSLPTRSSVINPFASEAVDTQRDKISSTRVVYAEGPIKHDFSSGIKTHSELGVAAAATTVENERENFEAAKRINVESWITQGDYLKPNYVNKGEYQVSNGKQPFDRNFTGVFPSRTVDPVVCADVGTKNVLPTIPARTEAPICGSQISSEVFKAPNADLSNIATGTSVTPGMKQGEELREEIHSRNLPATGKAKVLSADKTWDYKEIHLSKQTVHLINLDNEGWLTVEEFMTAFTSYKIPDVILKILDIQNARIPFRYIQRVNYPTLFGQLERTSLAVPRNHKNAIGDVLHLAPLKSLLKMLRKLKIVDLKEVELAANKRIFPSKTTALFDACTIITIYANIRREVSS